MLGSFLNMGVKYAAGHKFMLAACVSVAITAFGAGWKVHDKFVAASTVKQLEAALERKDEELAEARQLDRLLQNIAASAAKSWRETVVPVRERVVTITETKEVVRDAVQDIEDDTGRIDEPAIRSVCVVRADLWGLNPDLCNTAE
jgi:hypothetical protein